MRESKHVNFSNSYPSILPRMSRAPTACHCFPSRGRYTEAAHQRRDRRRAHPAGLWTQNQLIMVCDRYKFGDSGNPGVVLFLSCYCFFFVLSIIGSLSSFVGGRRSFCMRSHRQQLIWMLFITIFGLLFFCTAPFGDEKGIVVFGNWWFCCVSYCLKTP